MTSRPGLVSIITPTRNQARYVEQTLRSVRGQTYADIEHIVVDGASTDGTQGVLARYEGSYRLRWLSEPDSGMYEAINKGLRMAQGEVLAYLNSDDRYFPWTVSRVVAAFQRHPATDFVYGDLLQLDEACRCQRIAWQMPFDPDYVRRFGVIAQPTVFWRRRAYEDLGPFDERLRYVADCDYWMRATERHQFLKISEFLAIDREQATAYRSTESDAVWAELAMVRSRHTQTQGLGHAARVLVHRAHFALRRRFYWLAFTLQASLDRPVRVGPWSRFLSMPGLDLSRKRALENLLPRRGDKVRDGVVLPGRYWPDVYRD